MKRGKERAAGRERDGKGDDLFGPVLQASLHIARAAAGQVGGESDSFYSKRKFC